MGATVGANEEHLLGTPRPELLREISGLAPEPDENHVRLDRAGVTSIQRLRIGEVGGGVTAAIWPAELKRQAAHFYSKGRAQAVVAAARRDGWTVRASPHLGYYTSPPSRRLYFDLEFDVDRYITRWSGPDAGMIGEYSSEEVRGTLWAWLLERGYAAESDRSARDEFLVFLGTRGAHLRPGLRLHRRWSADDVSTVARAGELAAAVRAEVNVLLRAAGEPVLPLRGG